MLMRCQVIIYEALLLDKFAELSLIEFNDNRHNFLKITRKTYVHLIIRLMYVDLKNIVGAIFSHQDY